MDAAFYTDTLYPFQDRVLGVIVALETEFYLTRGTAASRGYLSHRFSDDLDLFVNDRPEFGLWSARIVTALSGVEGWRVEVLLNDERFTRFVVADSDVELKVALINDVPAHTGDLRDHPVLGRLDAPENILANKVTAALDRSEPKDLADIWGFCQLGGLSLDSALGDADSKMVGVFPADLARVLLSVSREDYDLIRWQQAPGYQRFRDDLFKLGESLLLLAE